jgi:ABC-type multidrug transport system fused ATPase/permease subunit
MLTGDALAVLLSLGGLALATAVTAYTLNGAKARNLWIVSAIFAAATFGWAWLQTRFDATRVYQILFGIVPLIVVVLAATIVRSGLPSHERTIDREKMERRLKLIDDARRLAVIYSQGRSGPQSFRQYLESTQAYASIRQHLDPEYLNKLNAPRVAYSKPAGARYEPLVQWFLDELDRLERAWNLD